MRCCSLSVNTMNTTFWKSLLIVAQSWQIKSEHETKTQKMSSSKKVPSLPLPYGVCHRAFNWLLLSNHYLKKCFRITNFRWLIKGNPVTCNSLCKVYSAGVGQSYFQMVTSLLPCSEQKPEPTSFSSPVNIYDRIMQYSNLEGTNKDDQIQLLAPYGITQKSNHIFWELSKFSMNSGSESLWPLSLEVCSGAEYFPSTQPDFHLMQLHATPLGPVVITRGQRSALPLHCEKLLAILVLKCNKNIILNNHNQIIVHDHLYQSTAS